MGGATAILARYDGTQQGRNYKERAQASEGIAHKVRGRNVAQHREKGGEGETDDGGGQNGVNKGLEKHHTHEGEGCLSRGEGGSCGYDGFS